MIKIFQSGQGSIFCTCPDGNWHEFEGSCYKVYATTTDFISAQQHCLAESGHLAVIDSSKKTDFIRNNVTQNHLSKYWIGLRDIIGDNQETSYQWISTNQSLNSQVYRNWLNDIPVEVDYTCVIYSANGWINIPCSYKVPFVCEKNVGRYILFALLHFQLLQISSVAHQFL